MENTADKMRMLANEANGIDFDEVLATALGRIEKDARKGNTYSMLSSLARKNDLPGGIENASLRARVNGERKAFLRKELPKHGFLVHIERNCWSGGVRQEPYECVSW